MTVLRGTSLVLGTFAISFGIGHLAAGRLPSTPPDPIPPLYTADQYAAATQPVEGELRPAALPAFAHARVEAGGLLIVVRGVDIRTCEDLGRQIRALRHTVSKHIPLIALTDAADTSLLREFLRRERIPRIAVAALSPDSLLSGPERLPTPAVIVFSLPNTRVSGIAHPLRFPNARFRSFADELHDTLSRRGWHAGPPLR